MPVWEWSGERAILRRFDDADLAIANRRALAFAQRLRADHDDLSDVIPGARTVLVVLSPGVSPTDALLAALEETPEPLATAGARHDVRVTYDAADTDAVAERHGLTKQELIDLHSSAIYTVAFTGFAPGFPYLLGLPERLHTPRFATPRKKVRAGSVAIAGAFAGIYPRETPGGWRLIGHTDIALFDASRKPPALLNPGDEVRFVPA